MSQEILRSGVEPLPSCMDAESTHQLVEAIANDSPEEMGAILASGGTLAAAIYGSPLHVAATYGSADCARHLLSVLGEWDPDGRDTDGHTSLHLAAADGDVRVIRALLEAGADTAAPTRDTRVRLMNGGLRIDCPGGRTPLHVACARGNRDAVEVLMAAGPAELLLRKDDDGACPLEVALREGAKGGRADLSASRVAIAGLLAPSSALPSMELLRRQGLADERRRRERIDRAERAANLNKEARVRVLGLPCDWGYKPGDSTLYSAIGGPDLLPQLSSPLSSALDLDDVDTRGAALRALCREVTSNVFAFQLFPASAAGAATGVVNEEGLRGRLLREVAAVEAWAASSGWSLTRPNSMNRYGLVLGDVGLAPVADALATLVVLPLVAALWPERVGRQLKDRHAFTVRYRMGEDRQLDTHVDSSEVTLNVCLGGEFQGGGVYFHGRAGEQFAGSTDPMTTQHQPDCKFCAATHPHEPGVALLHFGDHIHGARSITEGERTNLILWCRERATLGG